MRIRSHLPGGCGAAHVTMLVLAAIQWRLLISSSSASPVALAEQHTQRRSCLLRNDGGCSRASRSRSGGPQCAHRRRLLTISTRGNPRARCDTHDKLSYPRQSMCVMLARRLRYSLRRTMLNADWVSSRVDEQGAPASSSAVGVGRSPVVLPPAGTMPYAAMRHRVSMNKACS